MAASPTQADIARAACAAEGARPDALIEILHAVQAACGYVPSDVIAPIAEALNISRAEVHGVVTFYHDFRDAPAGRCVVKLCRAEACQAVGGDALATDVEGRFGAKTGATSADGRVTLEPAYCLGNCALGPAVMVDGRLYGRMTPLRLAALVEDATA